MRLLMQLKSPFNVPVIACLFAWLAFFYQLLRNAINPSNCYGTIPGWSSELDGFLFTADVPAVLSAMLVVAFYHLEILQVKRLTGPKLDKLTIPAAITIVLLFVLQLVVFTVVNTGNDASSAAIIVQAAIFLICFVLFLTFFFVVTTRLVVRICKSPQKRQSKLRGPLILAIGAIIGSFCAFVAGGIVLADLTSNATLFVLLEVFSDLSTICCCFAIAIVIKAKPPRAKDRSDSSFVGRLSRSFTTIIPLSPRKKDTRSSGDQNLPVFEQTRGLSVVVL